MQIAGIPCAMGVFALVETKSNFGGSVVKCDKAAVARCTSGLLNGVRPEGLSPIRCNVRVSAAPFLIVRLYSSTPFFMDDLKIESIFLNCEGLSDRISISAHDSNGMELTEVPPPVRPTLKLVFIPAEVNRAASSEK